MSVLPAFAGQPAAAQEVRPSEAIPLDSLDVISADTVPVLEPRFREGGGPERLSRVPSEDVLRDLGRWHVCFGDSDMDR